MLRLNKLTDYAVVILGQMARSKDVRLSATALSVATGVNEPTVAKILKDLSLREIRLLTNNPLKVEALQRHGIKVAEQIQHATSPSPYNARYLATKRERMAHKL